ncbi:hypothetical protein [Photobacterium chitinilyticum]|nr:hypothetical protein [Photobacterium chitinilyticum]
MLNLLASGGGHPYHALFGKEKQSPGVCKTLEEQYIMAQFKHYNAGIDQEALCDSVTLEVLFKAYEQVL